ncbi:MAG TPA: glycoside hydrolase family 15 protein [Lacunisphaera sp.]|nr:glycoside hydrolase family 15 protein [Lacunisphaera sp.]
MRIEDLGFIGDLETCALVARDGSIPWLCVPRFDSPACFAHLLGTAQNGHWRIAPAGGRRRGRAAYRDGTLVLDTTFETARGCVRLTDFMAIGTPRSTLVRIVTGVRGRVAMELEWIVRFDYGATVPWVRRANGGLLAVAGPNALLLRTAVATRGEGLATRARFTVGRHEQHAFVLSWFPSHEQPPDPIDPRAALRATERYWSRWIGRSHYQGPWQDAVNRSLVTLKGLIYQPTGGVLAAATTSLPERPGGVRNWDYRYCWLRDATFTLYALMHAGYTAEATAWGNWLQRAVAGLPGQLHMLYGAAGERLGPEMILPHLRGFAASRPVRVGNAAATQFQLDVYGEVIDALHLKREMGLRADRNLWRLQCHLADFVVRHWAEPDEGIWEVRGPRRHFTHSKMMAWVALDRAVSGARRLGLDRDARLWQRSRDRIHREVCARGFNPRRGAFTQYFGSRRLDASLLLMPLVGFLPATDPRVRGTIEAIRAELLIDGLVHRYLPHRSGQVDGLPPGEGAFLPCSFWLVDCLVLLGRIDEARELFEHLLTLRTPLGLLAEEYDPTRRCLVGNFPQAFSHVALINSAQNLSGHVQPARERSAGSRSSVHATARGEGGTR